MFHVKQYPDARETVVQGFLRPGSGEGHCIPERRHCGDCSVPDCPLPVAGP